LASEATGNALQQMLKACTRLAKELMLFSGLGVLCGAGVGFFMFARLGFPNNAETAGHISALFVTAGIKLGISVWVIRRVIFALRRRYVRADVAVKDSERAPGLGFAPGSPSRKSTISGRQRS
jgi:hypothetical protein